MVKMEPFTPQPPTKLEFLEYLKYWTSYGYEFYSDDYFEDNFEYYFEYYF